MTKTIEIKLSDKAERELEALRKRLKVDSVADVIRCSVGITDFLTLQKKKGNDIIIKQPNGREKNLAWFGVVSTSRR